MTQLSCGKTAVRRPARRAELDISRSAFTPQIHDESDKLDKLECQRTGNSFAETLCLIYALIIPDYNSERKNKLASYFTR